jgi:hypothetical protein
LGSGCAAVSCAGFAAGSFCAPFVGNSSSAGISGVSAVCGCTGAVFSALVMRGLRPRGFAGAAGAAAAIGSGSAADVSAVFAAASATAVSGAAVSGAVTAGVSAAGVSFFRPRLPLFSAGVSCAEPPVIFSISSRFFTMTSSMPRALAISCSSARLFPSSAFKSCIYFYFKVIFSKIPAVAGRVGIRLQR